VDAFYRIMAVLVDAPWLGAVPGLGFLGLWHGTRAGLALAAGLAWLAYVPYEYAMKLRVLCSGECNIRVDLLALYPALVALSLLAAIATARRRRRAPG
jgi:hypothetical protein